VADVFFPPGLYKVVVPSAALYGISLPSNTTLHGARGQSQIRFDGGGSSPAAYEGLRIDARTASISRVVIRDLVLFSNNVAVSGGTVCRDGISFHNATGFGALDIVIEGCEIYYFEVHGIHSDGGGGTDQRIAVFDCTIHDLGTVMMNTSQIVSGISLNDGMDYLVLGNRLYNIGTTSQHHGIYASRSYGFGKFVGNTFPGFDPESMAYEGWVGPPDATPAVPLDAGSARRKCTLMH
jgi:hypothetical protein